MATKKTAPKRDARGKAKGGKRVAMRMDRGARIGARGAIGMAGGGGGG